MQCFLSLNQLIMKKDEIKIIVRCRAIIGKVLVLAVVLYASCFNCSYAMGINSIDSQNVDSLLKKQKMQVTEIGFGGPAIKISRFNGQLAIMTGGRGSAVINNRFTVGGGGYGIFNSIKIYGSENLSSRIYKMGYGGLELGYVFYSRPRLKFGSSVLFATGASFWMSNPKIKNESPFKNDFNFITVLEPTVYGEIKLNRWLKLHAGITYRYVAGSNLTYIQNNEIRDFSGYFGILFGI